MATIKLIPSTYYLTSTSYLRVSNASNMYHDVSNTTYATVTNSRTSTTSYYIYIRGFNFDDIPSGAIVNSFNVRIKGNYSGGYSQNMYLYNGTTALSGSASSLTTSVATREFSSTPTWEEIVDAGSDFGIRINCRRSSRNTTSYIYIYGAEIEVDYTIPDPCVITSSLTGNGTIDPSGAFNTYVGAEYELTISPTNKSDTVTATKDGVDITSQLVAHGSTHEADFTASDVETSGIQSGSSYAQYCIGYTAENPYSSSSNMYASDEGYAEYSFDFSSIPSGAVIEGITVKAYGHRESATIDSSHISKIAIYNGTTKISDDVDFPSTSSTLITCEATTLPSSMSNVVLRHTVGYYGGLVLGITFQVTYSTGSGIDHYTYTFTTTGDSIIAVRIGSEGETNKLYLKVNGAWTEVEAYKKVNGTWVKQTESPFDTNTHYRKG